MGGGNGSPAPSYAPQLGPWSPQQSPASGSPQAAPEHRPRQRFATSNTTLRAELPHRPSHAGRQAILGLWGWEPGDVDFISDAQRESLSARCLSFPVRGVRMLLLLLALPWQARRPMGEKL
ncbi:hypothetical protein KIL84_012916 [Mauremys mutica]|uniref:Uncharacterized protein n=1 Tax=Mauremys mutica TaxID=74926 RepID=A0A9D3XTM6_9SAUR|nr:hypothetical protein KIL84_012916 [Mauremys mutica]